MPRSSGGTLQLIDTHAHLDEIEDLPEALGEARDTGVVAVIAVGTGYDSNEKTLEISQKHKGLVFPALGLHPGQLAHTGLEETERTLHQIEDNINLAVAIGEIGLDYDKRVKALAPKERQKGVFAELMKLARKYHKPAIIHSRYAWQDALAIAVEADIRAAVFHWYTGPSGILHEIMAQGYFISATPASEYHTEHRRAVKETPLSRLLLETDAPVAYGREDKYVSRPRDVLRTLSAAAKIKGIDEAQLAEQTTRNALEFFSIIVSS